MDLQLRMTASTDDSVVVGYTCPCGCNPRIDYVKGADPAVEGCCCGNMFAVGPDAASVIRPTDGFAPRVAAIEAPWGQPLQVAWAIGPSRHADDPAGDAGDSAPVAAVDPVCGMPVDIAAATARDLHLAHEGADYYFCGRGCKLEFGDAPGTYLDPGRVPSM